MKITVLLRLLAIACFLLFLSPSAFASNLCDNYPHHARCIQGHEVSELRIIPDAGNKKLAPRGLYRVEISCHSNGPLPSEVFDYFVSKQLSASLLVAISEKNTDGTPKPEESKMMLSAYNVGGPATSRTRYLNSACSGRPFFIAPRHPLYLLSTEANVQTNVLGPALKGLEAVINVVNSIWPLFTGLAIPDDSAKRLGALRDTAQPVQSFVSAFDSGLTESKVELLSEGRTRIISRFAKIDVHVTSLRSIVLVGDQFQVDLDDMLLMMTSKSAISDTDNSASASACFSIASQLQQFQNLSREDVAYSLLVLARAAGLQQAAQYINCLGRDYALIAVDQGFVNAQLDGPRRFTKDTVLTVLPEIPTFPQPDFARVKDKLADIMAYLRIYEATSPTPDFAVSELGRSGMASTIEIKDRDSIVWPTPAATVNSVDLLGAIKAKGYTRFGCLAADNNAVAFFFGLPEKPASDKGYTIDSVLLFRSWLNADTKISRLELSQEGDQIDAIIQKYKNKCGPNVKFASQ